MDGVILVPGVPAISQFYIDMTQNDICLAGGATENRLVLFGIIPILIVLFLYATLLLVGGVFFVSDYLSSLCYEDW